MKTPNVHVPQINASFNKNDIELSLILAFVALPQPLVTLTLERLLIYKLLVGHDSDF